MSTQEHDQGDRPRRLLRSRADRVIGGVCGGLGRYFGADPLIFRIATVALIFVGGLGALLYLIALLVVPEDTSEPAAEPTSATNRTLIVVGIVALVAIAAPLVLPPVFVAVGVLVPLALLMLAGLVVWWLVSGEGGAGTARDVLRRSALGVGVILLCAAVAIGGGWAAATGGGAVVAGLVIASGVLLVAGAFLGGARWLILPALSLGLSLAFVSAAGIDLRGGVGQRDYRPASAAQIKDRYRLGMGSLVVDLRDAELPPGDRPLRLDLGVGQAVLLVAENVCVATRAQVGMGEVAVLGRHNGGLDIDWEDTPRATAGTTRLIVDADVGVGSFQVRHRDLRGFGRGRRFGEHRRFQGFDRGPMEHRGTMERGNTACIGAPNPGA
jgi:phage shock protein PspC (stress-responsive transcriptional regulator)